MKTKAFFLRYKSFFVFVPVALIVFILGIFVLNELTGRSTQADVGAIVDVLMAAIKCVVAIVLAAIVKADGTLTRAARIGDSPEVTSWQEMAVTRFQAVLLVAIFIYGLSH